MRKNVRNMITAMALSAALCVVGGTAILVQGKASAEETSYVSVLEGASLRITGEFGFRFKTFIDKEDWSDNMEVHTLMIPTSELAAGEELVADSSN